MTADRNIRTVALEAAARCHDGSAWSSETGSSVASSVLATAEAFADWLTGEETDR
jgi:hypothetical protein